MHSIGLDQAIAATRSEIERLNTDQFHRMVKLGILREDEPIELIDAILVRKHGAIL